MDFVCKLVQHPLHLSTTPPTKSEGYHLLIIQHIQSAAALQTMNIKQFLVI